MEHLANAAYEAFVNKTAPGETSHPFDDLPPVFQEAWIASVDATLKKWMETDFRKALDNPEQVMMCMAVFKVSATRKDPIIDTFRFTIGSFVAGIILPDWFDRVGPTQETP